MIHHNRVDKLVHPEVEREMKMDEKWIPSMPIASWKNWTSRGKELSAIRIQKLVGTVFRLAMPDLLGTTIRP